MYLYDSVKSNKPPQAVADAGDYVFGKMDKAFNRKKAKTRQERRNMMLDEREKRHSKKRKKPAGYSRQNRNRRNRFVNDLDIYNNMV